MKRIVQKFGGTSLDTAAKRELVVGHIKKAIENDYKPAVVVSAMGRLGKPYATDTLLQMAEKAYFEIEPREKDLLMACGEIISTVTMVQTLRKAKIAAIALTGAQAGIITDDNFGESEIKIVNPERVLSIIKEDKIPVIAGFQGITTSGDITTFGRGGSDTTATVIAAAIAADYVEIYTDVAGVMTADPNMVDNAKIINQVSYNEVCELAYQGARVIHPRAAEIAMKEGIPIKVKSTFEKGAGTLIHNRALRGIKGDHPVTGVTSRDNIAFVRIKPNKPAEYATGLLVFNILADHSVSVDFINIRPDGLSFVIEASYKDKVNKLLLENNFQFEIGNDFVKVSVVGGGMTGRPGVLAKMVKSLSEKGIAIYQTTDSHTTISCLLKKIEEKKALNLLHDAFKLNN